MAELDPRDARLTELERLMGEALTAITTLRAENAALRTENAALKAEVAEVKAKLNQNSSNSNKPPSSDGPTVVPPPRKPKGKKRGGQPGHDPNRRVLLDPALCRAIYRYQPTRCPCGSCRFGKLKRVARHQVTYLPQAVAPTDEHQSFKARCKGCGKVSVEPIPPEILASAFGPCVTAFIAQLAIEFRLPKRSIQKLLKSLYDIDISLGAISDQEQVVAAALEAPFSEAHQQLKKASRANADETGWPQNKKRAWLWVGVSELCTVFLIQSRRDGKAAQTLLGKGFEGALGTDRWVSYGTVEATLRQLCWAHLLRDFIGWTELGGEGKRLGRSLLRQCRKMFKWWALVKDGTLSRRAFKQRMKPVRERVSKLLQKAEVCSQSKVSGMAGEILDVEYGLFTFVDHEGIEPTNNEAERALRHAVIYRKVCLGTDSEKGSRFVERMLTAVATLRRQGREARTFVTKALIALRLGTSAPSLLPAHA
jgi:transposase